jgi:hypothetical protein
MAHSYQTLHDHFVTKHPDALDAFKLGWRTLPAVLRKNWEEKGQKKPGAEHYKNRDTAPTRFISWTKVCWANGQNRWSKFKSNALCETLLKYMPHEGVLFGLPAAPAPKITTKVGIGYPSNNLYECDKKEIASAATSLYLKMEWEKTVSRMKAKIEKEGACAMLTYFRANGIGGEWHLDGTQNK